MASIEHKVFDWLEEAIEAAVEGEPLYEAELHDTVHQTIKKNFGIRIGEVERSLAPEAEGEAADFDALVPLIFFCRVAGLDKTERLAALDKCDELEKTVASLLFVDSSLGGRVCDCLILRTPRGFDSIKSEPYAVANMPLVINPSGLIDWERR